MKNSYWVILICGIILLPTVFFPISGDASIFALGGKTIADGGRIYVDYLDLKPPGMFILFAFLSKTIGISIIPLRLFDMAVQFVTCLLLFNIIKKRSDIITGVSAAFIYASLYASGGYGQSLQAESFVGVASCLIFILLDGNHSVWKMLLTGCIIALLISLKYTFGVIGAGVILFLFIDNKHGFMREIRNTALIALGTLGGLIIGFYPLFNHLVFQEYRLTFEYMFYYSSLIKADGAFLRDSIKAIGDLMGDKISLLVTISAALGSSKLLYMKKSKESEYGGLLIYFFLIGIFLFISIVIEKKYLHYHFYRTYAALSVFSGAGLSMMIPRIKESFSIGNLRNKIIITIFIVIAIVFSPLTRVYGLFIPMANYFNSYDKYLSFYERGDGVLINTTHLAVANYLDCCLTPDSLSMVISNGGNPINYFRRGKFHSKFSQSAFLMGSFVVPKWQAEFSDELRRAAALAVQTDDIHPTLTGFNGSSYDWLQKSKYWKYINSNFKEVKRIGCFILFRRNAV